MRQKSDIQSAVSQLKPSATVSLNEHSNALIQQGRKIYKFGLGQSPFPVPEPVVEALKTHAHEKDYLPVKGLLTLRESIQRYLKTRTGLEYDCTNILVGPGSKELMFLLQLVLNRQLILPQASWVSYAPQAILVGRQPLWVPTDAKDRWCLTVEALAKAIEHKPLPSLLVLNYPSNPTGQTFSQTELKKLADFARANDMIVLSDEIYGNLAFDGEYKSIARYYPEGTIISSGLSKWCGAGGWRIGFFAAPKNLSSIMKAMAVAASETFTSVSAPIQYAAVRAFLFDQPIQEYVERSTHVLAIINDEITQRLNRANIHTLAAQGGFYIMPDFTHFSSKLAARGIHQSEQLCQHLLDELGVAVLPGSDFGIPPERLIVRLAFVDFNGGLALTSAFEHPEPDKKKILAVAQHLLEGIDQLVDWTQRLE